MSISSAILYTFCSNQPEICEFLLSKGARINTVNKGGCSTLHVAVNKQQVKCVKILLRHRCDVNIQVIISQFNLMKCNWRYSGLKFYHSLLSVPLTVSALLSGNFILYYFFLI